MFLCSMEKPSISPFSLNSMHCDVSELLRKYEFSFSIFNKVFKFILTNLQFYSLSIGLLVNSIALFVRLFTNRFKRIIKI